ncbi:putative bacterial ABC-type protein transporter [Helianthus annuus]|nr:putative bacterial ABC-type protein transporter [Helianthus annuus]KAJ0587749.1 putative bacterial ABC-type protein transporter [Helianthus annuus]KAJ0596216.1 putative bacterial ABC-type protein transporter [Helianthus annuus]KAJ0756871.1 putative bacterial ABC-type protein transporter [Helianthus annuus]KAJ0760605.1 putative bacterial ABC-type protein transporter [Helianthus annuus]
MIWLLLHSTDPGSEPVYSSLPASSSTSSMDLVTNGSVDFRGRVANKKKTGGWKASPFIIANEAAERLSAFTVSASLVLYLTKEMKESLPDAATHVSDWVGATYLLMLLGAFLADAYLGRYLTVILSSAVYLVGMVMLTVSASVNTLRPPPCTATSNCPSATQGQTAFLYSALALVALGTGGVKPNVPSFGADQHDENDEKELSYKYTFFNFFFLSIKVGALLGLTIMVYIEQEKGYAWGFGLPTGIMFASVLILAAGFPRYRYKKPMGSVFTRFVQVIVVSVRNHFKGVEVSPEVKLYEVATEESDIVGARKLSHTPQYGFLDKAAVMEDPELTDVNDRWKLCTVTQVEELKTFLRVFPVWASTIALSLSLAQQSTFFLAQSKILDRHLGSNFVIPPGSMQVFAVVNAFITVPIYERFVVPVLQKRTNHHRGLTSLQRMGLGLFISIFALASAAAIEHMRRTHSNPEGLSVFWLVPQFFILGGAESFTYVGQLEFFYDEATDGMKSVCGALFLSEIGIGSWVNSALVKIVERATGTGENGWLRDDLNESKLDYYYSILAAISAVNLFIYVWVARRYTSPHQG